MSQPEQEPDHYETLGVNADAPRRHQKSVDGTKVPKRWRQMSTISPTVA